MYQPTLNQSNPVDGLAYNPKDNKIYAFEVKTKASMMYYPSTGMDTHDHETYLKFPVPVCVIFIDEKKEEIYYQWINQLEKYVQEIPNNNNKTVMYPLSIMKHYRKLNEEELNIIREHSNSNYK